jgi:fluoride exporter
MSALVWFGVAALGGAGALLRFRLDGYVQLRTDGEFPLGTFVVNVLGSLCLGVLVGSSVAGAAVLLAGTAFLGSFTTFSTWMLETERLAEGGEGRLAVLNLAISVVAGLGSGIVGWLIGAAL